MQRNKLIQSWDDLFPPAEVEEYGLHVDLKIGQSIFETLGRMGEYKYKFKIV